MSGPTVELPDWHVVKETDLALGLVEADDIEAGEAGLSPLVWVPRSLLEDGNELHVTGDTGTLVVPEWWAEQEGLV